MEGGREPLYVDSLDLEKTFDRVKQDKLIEALERMEFPPAFLGAIKSLYDEPTFAVRVGGTESSWKKQARGIRQGCPLSPYLFIILMTVLFRDVHSELNMSRGKLEGLDFTELIYADDTALITNNVNAMNRLVAKIEEHAAYYGLNFNKGKCVSMHFHAPGRLRFPNGEFIKEVDEAVYLGGVISKKHDTRREVAGKISSCFAVLNRLNAFWFKSNCPKRFKLNVLDAVIRSKLVYGLEAIQLPQSLLMKLDTFQLKGLRKILGFDTTFVNRSNTNKRVFETANQICNPLHKPDKYIKTFSHYVLNRQEALLKHTVRASNADPLRQVTLIPDTSIPRIIENRRVGRPRDHWAYNTLERMYVKYGFGTKTAFKNNITTSCRFLETRIHNRII